MHLNSLGSKLKFYAGYEEFILLQCACVTAQPSSMCPLLSMLTLELATSTSAKCLANPTRCMCKDAEKPLLPGSVFTSVPSRLKD